MSPLVERLLAESRTYSSSSPEFHEWSRAAVCELDPKPVRSLARLPELMPREASERWTAEGDWLPIDEAPSTSPALIALANLALRGSSGETKSAERILNSIEVASVELVRCAASNLLWLSSMFSNSGHPKGKEGLASVMCMAEGIPWDDASKFIELLPRPLTIIGDFQSSIGDDMFNWLMEGSGEVSSFQQRLPANRFEPAVDPTEVLHASALLILDAALALDPTRQLHHMCAASNCMWQAGWSSGWKGREDLAVDERKLAQKAMAAARHAENRAMKRQVLEWYADHRSDFRSLDAAATSIAGRIAPIAVRTARAWIGEWVKANQGTPQQTSGEGDS